MIALASCLSTTISVAQVGVSAPPVLRPGEVTCTNHELMKRVPCPDSTLFFHEGEALVEQAFHQKDFERLDKLYEAWCTGAERFPDGRWKLSTYSSGLGGLFSAWNVWGKHFDNIKSWQQAHPSSPAAVFAEAVYWSAYASKARGTGYARSVSKEGWEIFRERLLKAKSALERPVLAESACPASYPLMLAVMTDTGASEEQLRAVFAAGVRKSPEYHPTYFAMARHYEPKWGGSAEEYERFAVEATQLTKNFEGMGMYARIYWLVDQENGIPFRQNSKHPPAWKDLRAGYEELLKRYPSSLNNLGKYAGVACRSPDSELYRKLRSRIQGYEQSAQMLDPVDVCDRRHNWSSKATTQ